jgi:hypothetical protein
VIALVGRAWIEMSARYSADVMDLWMMRSYVTLEAEGRLIVRRVEVGRTSGDVTVFYLADDTGIEGEVKARYEELRREAQGVRD